MKITNPSKEDLPRLAVGDIIIFTYDNMCGAKIGNDVCECQRFEIVSISHNPLWSAFEEFSFSEKCTKCGTIVDTSGLTDFD